MRRMLFQTTSPIMILAFSLFLACASGKAARESLAQNAAPAIPQAFEGNWEGTLTAGGTKLLLKFSIDRTSVKLDVPAQGLKGAKASSTAFGEGTMTAKFAAFGAEFGGKLLENDSIEGSWKQRGASFPLTLARVKEGESHADSALTYGGEGVEFESGQTGTTLAGTLLLPQGQGPFPAVVLVTGSGPQNRDEEILGHKPFRTLAESLQRLGWATLRYDDRGTGESKGTFAGATSADFAHDAAGAYRFLERDPRIDKKRIALCGHSEGGYVILLSERLLHGVHALVLLAAPGIGGFDIIMDQNRDFMAAAGVSISEIEEKMVLNRTILELSLKEGNYPEAEARKLLAKAGLPEDRIKLQIAGLSDPGYRAFLASDPGTALAAVKSPLLAFNGSKDIQVRADRNLQAIERAVPPGVPVKTKVWTGYNHLFQVAETGHTDEYARLGTAMPDEIGTEIVRWLDSLE